MAAVAVTVPVTVTSKFTVTVTHHGRELLLRALVQEFELLTQGLGDALVGLRACLGGMRLDA